MGVILLPIREGKLDVWNQWTQELNGSRREDITAFNRRYGLARHAPWLAETPSGQAVTALHEGLGGDDFLQKIASSQHQVDLWSKEKVKDVHDVDFRQPPPGPMPELYFDSGS